MPELYVQFHYTLSWIAACTHRSFRHVSFIFLPLSFKYLFKSDVLENMFMPLQELKSDDLIRIDNVDYNTKFFILRAKRLHSGKYTIIAKNSVGEDRADFDITVLGKYRDIVKKLL